MRIGFALALSALAELPACATVPEVRLSEGDRAACLEAAKPNSDVLVFGYGVCTEFGPIKRVKGVWLHGSELSGFLQGERVVPLKFDWVWDEALDYDAWLDVDHDWLLKRVQFPAGTDWCQKAVYLEFDGREGVRDVGRQSRDPMRVFTVERVLLAEPIGIFETTHRGRATHNIAYIERCKAERTRR